MAEFKTLDYCAQDGIAIATLNRPERMNTFNIEMMQDFFTLLDRTDGDDDIRALIVTGSGRAFCAGADLGSGGDTFDFEKKQTPDRVEVNGVVRDAGGRMVLRMFESKKPIIGAVNGAAAGIGATMLLPMDVRIAADNARFGFVFTRRGITPEACSSWFLPRLVGMPQALDWVFSGRVFPAMEALDGGLVQSLHDPDELLDAAIALARKLTDGTAPVSVALARQMLWHGAGAAHPMDAHRFDSRALQSRGQSGDAREGVGAFMEKRKAVFPNRVSSDLPELFPGSDAPQFS